MAERVEGSHPADSQTARVRGSHPADHRTETVPRTVSVKCDDGRGDWIRTSDPHTPSVMRYQAALRPDRSAAFRLGAPARQAPPGRQAG